MVEANSTTKDSGSVLLLVLFFLLLFLLNAYDLFFLLNPVRGYGLGKEPTLEIYIVANFLPRVIYYLGKFAIVGLLIWVGFMITNLSSKIELTVQYLFQLVVKLELILLCDKVYKIVYFSFINDAYTFDDYMAFHSLSLYNVVFTDYPLVQKLLKDLSFFDFAYMIVMGFVFCKDFSISISKSTLIVCACYLLPIMLLNSPLYFVGFT